MFSIRFALCICISMLPNFDLLSMFMLNKWLNIKKKKELQPKHTQKNKKKTKKYVVYFK